MKKTFKYALLLIFVLSLGYTNAGIAQQKQVKGIVTSADDNQPLPGVNIKIKSQNTGTVTGLDGEYLLENLLDENVLVFSFIGYETIEVKVEGQTTINIALKLQSENLDDIVVVGYGVQRKSDLTGSVSSIKTDDLQRIPTSSPMQALQGKVAGLQIVSSSGAPGAGVVVRVRGVGTFNNANPIFVVDGVILDNIDFLNTSDIESMEVLKDASATTIYGARGANGVIIVTTKNAKVGQKPTISFSYEMSAQKLQQRIDLLDGTQYATIVNEIKPGSYNNVDAVPNTNWQNEIFKDGFSAPIINAQLSASAGTEISQYYVGVGYFKQDGIIPKSNYERLSLKFNNKYKLTDFLSIGNNITINPYQQQNTNNNVAFVAYRAWPLLTPYDANGKYTPLPGTGNPIADIEYTNSYGDGINGVGSFYADLKLLKHFVVKTSYGVDLGYNRSKSFTPVFLVSPQQQNSISRLYKGNSTRNSWVWENTLSYFNEFGKHRIDALAGYSMQSVKSEYNSANGENIIRDSEDFWYLNPNNVNPNSVWNGVDAGSNYSMISYMFRLNYSFNHRYLFTGTYRIDGSSKFTENNRFAGFPAFAIGWNIHNEDFMQAVPIISNLKLKGSWGGIGNEKISYSRQYSLVGASINTVFGDDVMIPGQTYQTTGNPDLRWETTYQTNIGIEIGFWENKLTAEIDYFRKDTKDILIDLQLPGFVGNGGSATITKNAAEILNSGVEFNIGWKDAIGEFKYSVRLVGNTLHNEALVVRGTGSTDDYLVGGNGNTRTSIGLPVGAFYGYKTDGIFQNQTELDAYPHRADAQVGYLKFVDTNNDKKITDADRTFIGSPIPDVLFGLNFAASYKNFDLNIDFQGQYGNEIFNLKETIRPDLYNFEAHVWERWRGDATSNAEPIPTQGGYNFLPSTRFVQDGAFLRLRNLSIGYTLSQSVSQKLKLSNVRIYLSGANVYTLTKFTGYSPEVMGGPIDSGLDYSTYPVCAIYSCGIRITL